MCSFIFFLLPEKTKLTYCNPGILCLLVVWLYFCYLGLNAVFRSFSSSSTGSGLWKLLWEKKKNSNLFNEASTEVKEDHRMEKV